MDHYQSPFKPPAPPSHGKYVIAALIALGLVGAGGGWLYHRQAQRRAIALWGPAAAPLIVSAPQVEVLQLQPSAAPQDSNADAVAWGGQSWQIVARVDAAQAPGMPHLRHRLVQDASFDWSITPDDSHPVWIYAVRFSDGGRRATLLFDLDHQRVGRAESRAIASIAPIADGLKELLPGYFAEARP